MFSMKSILSVVQAFAPGAKAATTTSAAVDVAGYEAVTIEVNAGVVTDGTSTFSLTESNDNVTFTAVPAQSILGAGPTLTSGAGNGSGTISLFDYVGACRYIKVVLTIAAPTTGLILAVNVIKGRPRHSPAGAPQLP